MKELIVLLLLVIAGIIYYAFRVIFNRASECIRNFEVFDLYRFKKYWISRSVAVSCFIFKQDSNGVEYVLANKRGKGTPDFQGCWNCVCGYVDFNENTKGAAIREIVEETGYHINPDKLTLTEIIDDPAENKRQNIVFRYCAYYEANESISQTFRGGGEKDEVEEVKWIPVNDVEDYSWAFNHLEVIKKYRGPKSE